MGSDQPDDAVYAAEKQMAEYEVEQLARLFAKLSARFHVPEREEDIPTEDEMQEEIQRVLQEDSEARELLESLAAYRKFRFRTDKEGK